MSDDKAHPENELTVQRLHFEDGKLDAQFGGRVAEIIADAMVALFDEQGAKNYLEISLMHRATGRIFTLTMQLKGAKSPHELREAAEVREASLREALDGMLSLYDMAVPLIDRGDNPMHVPFTACHKSSVEAYRGALSGVGTEDRK